MDNSNNVVRSFAQFKFQILLACLALSLAQVIL